MMDLADGAGSGGRIGAACQARDDEIIVGRAGNCLIKAALERPPPACGQSSG